jgi:hypothetical protein
MARRISLAAILVTAALTATPVLAKDLCSVPKAEWQPAEMLQKKLEAEGWQVRNVKVEDGCYEAYAIDNHGKRVETLFDPKTLMPLNAKAD